MRGIMYTSSEDIIYATLVNIMEDQGLGTRTSLEMRSLDSKIINNYPIVYILLIPTASLYCAKHSTSLSLISNYSKSKLCWVPNVTNQPICRKVEKQGSKDTRVYSLSLSSHLILLPSMVITHTSIHLLSLGTVTRIDYSYSSMKLYGCRHTPVIIPSSDPSCRYIIPRPTLESLHYLLFTFLLPVYLIIVIRVT